MRGNGRNPNLKKVHVSLLDRELEVLDELARGKFHGFRSQALRALIEDFVERSRDDGGNLELRPVIERLNGIGEELAETLADLKDEIVNEVVDAMNSSDEVGKPLLDAIIKVLQKARHPPSAEAVWEELPGRGIREVLRGLETLEDRYVVEHLEQEGGVFWRLVGE